MEIKLKKTHKKAVIPKYAHSTDGCVDLTAVSMRPLHNGKLQYDTGIAIQIPPGYVGLVFPRSSIHKTELYLSNSVGVIDSGYTGSIKAVFNRRPYGESYQVGDRICQLMIIPRPEIEFVLVDDLETTDRADGAYGSTGQ